MKGFRGMGGRQPLPVLHYLKRRQRIICQRDHIRQGRRGLVVNGYGINANRQFDSLIQNPLLSAGCKGLIQGIIVFLFFAHGGYQQQYYKRCNNDTCRYKCFPVVASQYLLCLHLPPSSPCPRFFRRQPPFCGRLQTGAAPL